MGQLGWWARDRPKRCSARPARGRGDQNGHEGRERKGHRLSHSRRALAQIRGLSWRAEAALTRVGRRMRRRASSGVTGETQGWPASEKPALQRLGRRQHCSPAVSGPYGAPACKRRFGGGVKWLEKEALLERNVTSA
jgi:hypothetical protein